MTKLYDFSFAATQMRQTNGQVRQFRFRSKDEPEIKVDQIWGDCFVHGSARDAQGALSHLIIEATLVLKEVGGRKVAYLYPPKELPPDDFEPAVELPESHYRVCANRGFNPEEEQFGPWRFRNERTGELRYVNDYRGPMNMQWSDGGTHVFHDGAGVIDTEGVLHFRCATR